MIKFIIEREGSTSDSGVQLTMKKFLSFAIVAVLLSVAAFAAMPKADDFVANNGFFVFDNEAGAFTETRDQATVEDTAKGVKVVHGGYYSSGDNFGGVASAEAYDLNGLEVTILFEDLPDVTIDTDCWIAIDFLAAQRGFFTGNYDPANGGNNGIITLLRWGKPWTEFHGPGSWSTSYDSTSLDATQNAMFALKDGDSLTVKIARTELNKYTYTYSKEGFEDFTVPYEFDLADIMPDGKAYVVIAPSCRTSGEDGFTYYITDVKNGTPYTEEELAAIEAAKLAAENAIKREEAIKETDAAKEKAEEAMAEAEAIGDEDAIAKAEDALDAVAASYEAIEAENWEEARAQSDLARDYVKESGDFVKAAEKAAEGEGEDNEAGDEAGDATVVDTKEGSFPVVPVVIVVVVVLVAVIAVVVVKKKK